MTGPAGQWWSQRVAPEGYTASEGIRRQLGKPALDPLVVLVRETAQNSCDAASAGDGDVEFTINLHDLSGNRLEAWRQFLLPEPRGSGLDLERSMSDRPVVLTVSDRGTTGLGGPLRADEVSAPGERPDFVNFIRNVGERKAVELGGGSYGFGKGILYNVSRCHVVVVDSVCVYRGRRQRRLIGAALGDGHTRDGVRFTGRHWRGASNGDAFPEALLDDEADLAAAQLGLPRFGENATGTNVVVVDCDLGRRVIEGKETSRTAEEAADFLVSALLWNLWPRMLAGRPNRLRCTVKRDGFTRVVPDPEEILQLRPFTRAYRGLEETGWDAPVRRSPPTDVGRFALKRDMAPVRPDALVGLAAPFEGPAHHCARMRHADLVVDYVPGPPLTDEALQYGAVFRASEEADAYFSEAEPPTHDDWVLSGLNGTSRGVVLLAHGFVRKQLEAVDERPPPAARGTDVPLGAIAGRLAALMSTVPGDGADDGPGPGSRAARRRGRSVGPRFTDGPRLRIDDGQSIIVATVEFPEWSSMRSVRLEPQVVVDGGVEADDVVIDKPRVLDWTAVGSDLTHAGPELQLDRHDPRTWTVRVTSPSDAVVRLRLDLPETG